MILSPPQRAAVERTGQDVCVVAGPGSGKTRVLTERFAWLVERQRIDPARILAITFTEKAANEIKARLVKRFAASPELRESVERAWVSTIDGFCARLLRENAIAAGLPPDFAVIEAAAALRLQRDAAEQALEALYTERPGEMRRLLEALDLSTQDDGRQPDLAAGLLEAYEALRVSGVREIPPEAPVADVRAEVLAVARTILADRTLSGADAPKLRGWLAEWVGISGQPVTKDHLALLGRFEVNLNRLSRKGPGAEAARSFKIDLLPQLERQTLAAWNEGLPQLLRAALARVDQTYRRLKTEQAVVDFADLEERAIALLERDEDLRRETAGRFDEVLMDELQDTNPLQWRLVDLVRRRFFGVGDINQSIYGFRHADPAGFDRYRESLRATGAVIDQLDENYRSHPDVLTAVASVLDGQPGIEPRPLMAKGTLPTLEGPVVERLVGAGEQAADAARAEAGMVASRILELAERERRPWSDFAVLVRTLGSTQPFEQAFDRAGIPFLVSGGRTFLEARETRDLLGFLAALVNPLDDIALVGVLRSPLMGWSDAEICRAGKDAWRSGFEERFGRIRRLAGFVPPDQLISQALDECGYREGLSERACANIEKLLGWMRRAHRTRPRPLAELLDEVEAARELQADAEAPPPEAAAAVRLMSIHAAKGLEFRVVFVSALHRGPDRRSPVLAFSPRLGLGAKWRNPVSGKSVPDAVHAAVLEETKTREEQEENRLLYVAMTRAEHRLILSHAESKRPWKWVKMASAISPSSSDDPAARTAEGQQSPQTPVVYITPARAPAQYDSSAAVTSVALFDACPRRYYLSRYLGMEPEPDGPGTGAVELGLAVHAALAGQPVDSAEALALADRFRGSDLGQRAARASRIEKEFDFLLNVEDVILRGQIDLWFEESGELILVDYKTDRSENSVASYALQLRIYAMALEVYAGRAPDRAVLYYLRTERAVEVDVSAAMREEARRVIRSLREAQDTLEFPARVGEQCGRCSFAGGLCPTGGNWKGGSTIS